MTNEAFPTPKPGRRRAPQRPPARRRPIQRAEAWAKDRWDRLSHTRIPKPVLKKPSHKAMWWTGGILAGLAIAIGILIAIWDWNWFRGPLARYEIGRAHV